MSICLINLQIFNVALYQYNPPKIWITELVPAPLMTPKENTVAQGKYFRYLFAFIEYS